MTKLTMAQLSVCITQLVVENPNNLTHALMERFKVSRAAAAKALRGLVKEGWLERFGTTRPSYRPGIKRLISRGYSLPGLDEQMCWERDFRPFFSLSPNVDNTCHYGFTEMLNNANDHSGGSFVLVRMYQDEKNISVVIYDKGIGIFERIASSINLPDRRLALLELSKGKLTTDPENHTGEGIFFTSRVFNRFVIMANGLHYSPDSGFTNDWLLENEIEEKNNNGTFLKMVLSLSCTQTLREVFDSFTAGEDEDFSFNKTVVPVRLARLGNENLISRSQAKRLIQRFDRFRTIMLDFSGVSEIGQAFADEVFRVFNNRHPEITLIPTNTVDAVESMINRIRHAKKFDMNDNGR